MKVLSHAPPSVPRPRVPMGAAAALAVVIVAALMAYPGAEALAQDMPSGTIIVANMDDDSAWLLDAATGERRGTIQTVIAPHEVAVSTDGRTAAITNYGDQRGPGNLVQLVDVASGDLTGEFEVEGYERLHGAAFLPGDSLLALTSERTGEVLLVGAQDGGVRDAFSTGGQASHMLALGGPWIYVANIVDGTVSRIDPTGAGETRVWPAGERTEGVAATPDGAEGWTGSMQGGSVVGLDGATGEEVARIEGLAVPYRLGVTADGATVAVSDPTAGHLVLIDRSSGTVRSRVDINAAARDAGLSGDASPQGFTLTPDSRWALVSAKGLNRVAVVDLVSAAVVAFHATGSGPDGIAFSPCGSGDCLPRDARKGDASIPGSVLHSWSS